MKVLYITNLPTPYRINFFNGLNKSIDLTVLFERKKALGRNEKWLQEQKIKFKHHWLRGIKIFKEYKFSFDALIKIKKINPDVVIFGGYNSPTSIITMIFLKIIGKKFIINIDGVSLEKQNKIKKFFKKIIFNNASYFFVSGNYAKKYLTGFNIDEKNIFIFPFSSILKKDIESIEKDINLKNKLKKELNIKEEFVVITVGQFIHRKGFDILIKSTKYFKQKDIGFYFIGGKSNDYYEKLKKENYSKNIHFLDFKTKKELDKYYYCSDIFVLPTREDIWGLVINEALSKGLPIISTNKCIAALELIENSENGYIIENENIEMIESKINFLYNNRKMIKEMRKKNLNKIKSYTIEMMIKSHVENLNIIKK